MVFFPRIDCVKVPSSLHVEWVGDEAVVLDTDTGRIHYLNSSAALTYALIMEMGLKPAVRHLRRTKRVSWGNRKELKALIVDLQARGLLTEDHRA